MFLKKPVGLTLLDWTFAFVVLTVLVQFFLPAMQEVTLEGKAFAEEQAENINGFTDIYNTQLPDVEQGFAIQNKILVLFTSIFAWLFVMHAAFSLVKWNIIRPINIKRLAIFYTASTIVCTVLFVTTVLTLAKTAQSVTIIASAMLLFVLWIIALLVFFFVKYRLLGKVNSKYILFGVLIWVVIFATLLTNTVLFLITLTIGSIVLNIVKTKQLPFLP